MTEKKRVTYLIGAGASANALPVVNGMNERMIIFYDLLKDIHSVQDKKLASEKEFEDLKSLLDKITTHNTIDTYAKKLKYREDEKNYTLLKRFLICYLLYEQADKRKYSKLKGDVDISKITLDSIIDKKDDNSFNSDLFDKIEIQLDSRYDSFLASLLNTEKILNPNVNIVSWNYDMQLELAYSDFWDSKIRIDKIQNYLQVFPREINQKLDFNKSAVIKINGTGNYITESGSLFFDIINESFYEDEFIKFLFIILFNPEHSISRMYKANNQLKFAWENDEHVINARQHASRIIAESDAVVIIGYSFPTFNRDIDRLIFSGFDKNCFKNKIKRIDGEVLETKEFLKKIYIQDKKENANKVKERLKAVGENLFQTAEVYDDIDQFFIPPEL